MIKRQEFASTEHFAIRHIHLVHCEGEHEIERYDLGRNLATARQEKNGTEVYIISGNTILLSGKAGKHYLRRMKRPPYQVLASAETRDELYPYLFLFAKCLNGKMPRRNLFQHIDEVIQPKDPVDLLMKNMGYRHA